MSLICILENIRQIIYLYITGKKKRNKWIFLRIFKVMYSYNHTTNKKKEYYKNLKIYKISNKS